MEDNAKFEELVELIEAADRNNYVSIIIEALTDSTLLERLKDRFSGGNDESHKRIVERLDFQMRYLPHVTELKPVMNDPIDGLIEQMKSKGSRREAAKQIKRRFMGLDHQHQMQIMEMFLGMSYNYRNWGYKTLMEWREPAFDDTVIELWEKYKEERCAKLIANILPEEKVKGVAEDVVYSLDRKELFVMYKRFGMAKWFDVDKYLLALRCGLVGVFGPEQSKKGSIGKIRDIFFYMWAISITHESLPVADCADALYSYVQTLFEEEALDGMARDAVNNMVIPKHKNWNCIDFMDLKRWKKGQPTLRDFLKCCIRMGHYKFVKGVVSWMYSINKLLPAIKDDDQENGEYYVKRLKLFYQLARDNAPEWFVGIEDTPPCSARDFANSSTRDFADSSDDVFAGCSSDVFAGCSSDVLSENSANVPADNSVKNSPNSSANFDTSELDGLFNDLGFEKVDVPF